MQTKTIIHYLSNVQHDFNKYVDDSFGQIEVFDNTYSASDLLLKDEDEYDSQLMKWCRERGLKKGLGREFIEEINTVDLAKQCLDLIKVLSYKNIDTVGYEGKFLRVFENLDAFIELKNELKKRVELG